MIVCEAKARRKRDCLWVAVGLFFRLVDQTYHFLFFDLIYFYVFFRRMVDNQDVKKIYANIDPYECELE